jgi:hypothetical protein
MSAYQLIQDLIRNPGRVWIFSVFVMMIAALLGYTSYQELQKMPYQPELLSLEQIIAKPKGSITWVSVDSTLWDCQNIVMDYKGFGTIVDRTYAVFMNTDQTIIGVATFGLKQTCDEMVRAPLSGTITSMSAYEKAFYQKKGMDLAKYQNVTGYLTLCTWCGAGNSLSGLVCSFLLFFVALIFPMLCDSAARRNSRKNKVIVYG